VQSKSATQDTNTHLAIIMITFLTHINFSHFPAGSTEVFILLVTELSDSVMS